MKPQYTSILICTEAEYCKAIIIVFLLHIKTFREPVTLSVFNMLERHLNL